MTAAAWVAILDHELEVISLEWSNRKKGAWLSGVTKIASVPFLDCQISVSSSYETNKLPSCLSYFCCRWSALNEYLQKHECIMTLKDRLIIEPNSHLLWASKGEHRQGSRCSGLGLSLAIDFGSVQYLFTVSHIFGKNFFSLVEKLKFHFVSYHNLLVN